MIIIVLCSSYYVLGKVLIIKYMFFYVVFLKGYCGNIIIFNCNFGNQIQKN